MYRKAGDTLKSLDPRHAENLCDALFEIGRSLLQKEEFELAAKWLERSYNVIDGQDLENLSRSGIELRLTVLQALVQALVSTNKAEDLRRARDMVMYVEAEVGDNKPVVLLLRLELLMSVPDEEFDALAYADVLRRMVKSFNFTEAHFRFMMAQVRRLYERSAVLGCSVADELIVGRVLGAGKGAWVDKAVVMRVWMGTSRAAASEDVVELGDLLERVREGLEVPIQPTAAATAQSVGSSEDFSMPVLDL